MQLGHGIGGPVASSIDASVRSTIHTLVLDTIYRSNEISDEAARHHASYRRRTRFSISSPLSLCLLSLIDLHLWYGSLPSSGRSKVRHSIREPPTDRDASRAISTAFIALVGNAGAQGCLDHGGIGGGTRYRRDPCFEGRGHTAPPFLSSRSMRRHRTFSSRHDQRCRNPRRQFYRKAASRASKAS